MQLFRSWSVKVTPCASRLFAAASLAVLLSLSASAQRGNPAPVVVQPGAPGQASKILPASTRAKLPPTSRKDVEFMQGMIMHHAQAVEMTALIEERTNNKDLRLLGDRISKSQTDEMEFMKRWLGLKGESITHEMPSSHSHNAHGASQEMLMPGMLTKAQMDALKKAKGSEFDRLFLTGMVQHHEGALVMVDELFKTAGSGQDAELFNFASDVDSGQRAEIRSMETLLKKKP